MSGIEVRRRQALARLNLLHVLCKLGYPGVMSQSAQCAGMTEGYLSLTTESVHSDHARVGMNPFALRSR